LLSSESLSNVYSERECPQVAPSFFNQARGREAPVRTIPGSSSHYLAAPLVCPSVSGHTEIAVDYSAERTILTTHANRDRDRSYDIAGARNNGMLPTGVLYGYGSQEELIEAGA
jgi:hypothetical protein